MKWIALIPLLALAACDSPSPQFSGLVAKQVALEGSTFTVRHTAFEAEVIRTNFDAVPRRDAIFQKAAEAIRRASGCKILPGSMRGDMSVIHAALKCPGADEALRPPKRTAMECVGFEDPYWDGLIELECDLHRL